MPAEHYNVDGTLRQGYYCNNCGQPCGLYSHLIGNRRRTIADNDGKEFPCEPNPKLVAQLRRANPLTGIKPHFIRHAIVMEME